MDKYLKEFGKRESATHIAKVSFQNDLTLVACAWSVTIFEASLDAFIKKYSAGEMRDNVLDSH